MLDMKFYALPLLMILLTSCGENTALPATPSLAAVSTETPTPEPLPVPFAVIGYLPEYRTFNPKWARYATDIIYFSAEPRADGSLDSSRLSEETLDQLSELKNEFGARIYISVGGWGRSSGFAPMTAEPATRKMFIEDVLAFALAYNLDGVDVDWEFPEDERQFNNGITLLGEMKAALALHGMIVSAALSTDSEFPLSGYTVVDRVHIMSYDNVPRHSTYEHAAQDIQLFLDAGFPPEKLALGVPFYARGVNDFKRTVPYAEIVSQYQPAPEVDEVDGLYFNGITTIQQKTCFAKGQGAGGIMIWELGQDTVDDTSLLQAIYEAAMGGC